MNAQEWAQRTRQAWRQVHEKRQAKHITRHCPWTWNDFRQWFKAHYAYGIRILKIHEVEGGSWEELLRACRRGMILPNKAPF